MTAKKKKKEPMIGRESRPAAVDFDAPIADWQYRDLLSVIKAEIEIIKPERIKPEHWKPEWSKPEFIKPERIKPEQFKPEKEMLKPEKELSKPEKPFDEIDFIDRVANRVVELIIEKGFASR